MLVLHKRPTDRFSAGLVVGLLLLSVVLRRRGPSLFAIFILLVASLPLTADRIWTALESTTVPAYQIGRER